MAGVAVAQPPASLHQGNSSKPSLPCPFVQHSRGPDRSKGKGTCNAWVTAMTTAAGIGIGVAVGLLILAWIAVGPFWPKSDCSCQRDVNWVWSYWVEQIRSPLLWFFGDTRAAPSRPFALEFHLEWAVKNQPEIARFGLSSSGSSALLPLTPLSNPAAI
jgi:hypothetical protein